MQHQRSTNQATLLRLLLGLYVFASILRSGTRLHANGSNTIHLATAFVSSSSVNDNTAMNMKGRSDISDEDTSKLTTMQSESAVVTETGTIDQSNDIAPVPLLLPSSDENNENRTSINLGETISFAELGPIILNSDGTTRRIDNWNTLTKQEQETTWRRIKKRNAERRERLLLEQEQQKEAELSNNNSNAE